jgi:hypothetical protein
MAGRVSFDYPLSQQDLLHRCFRFLMFAAHPSFHPCDIISASLLQLADRVPDLGGQDSARATWSSYFPTAGTACALVIVADSTDKSRLPILRIELERLLVAEELKGSPVLVFANKQDLKVASL